MSTPDDPTPNDLDDLVRELAARLRTAGPVSRRALPQHADVELYDDDTGWFRIDELVEPEA